MITFMIQQKREKVRWKWAGRGSAEERFCPDRRPHQQTKLAEKAGRWSQRTRCNSGSRDTANWWNWFTGFSPAGACIVKRNHNETFSMSRRFSWAWRRSCVKPVALPLPPSSSSLQAGRRGAEEGRSWRQPDCLPQGKQPDACSIPVVLKLVILVYPH